MWTYIALLSLLVSYTSGSIEYVRGKVGSPVVLDLQYPVRTWMRVTNDGYIEAARYCDRPTDAPECSQFVNVMTNETASPYSKVSVFPNGTLIFANLTVNDTGARYYSPEMRPKVVNNSNGGVWVVPPKRIYLELAK